MDNQLVNHMQTLHVDPADELNPGEMLTEALHVVNRLLTLVYERCKISYADFLAHLQANDPDAADSLHRLWNEVDSDIYEQYIGGTLSRFAGQRWQNALNEWKEHLLSALHDYLNHTVDYDLQEFARVGYIEAA